MDLRGQEIKNTYGNVVTIGSSAGSPTTGELTNGQNSSFTASFVSGDFGVGITPNNYANLNTLTIGSAAASAGGIIDFTGTSGRLASIYTEASGKIVLAADPTNGEAGTALEFNVDGSNAMFIDASRRVGVNTTSPVSALTVVGTTTAGITVQSSSGASNGLKIFNDSITDTASIVNHYSGPLVLGTANTERMRITSAGDVQLVGNKYLYANPSAGSTTIGSGFNLDGSNNLMTLWTNDTERMRITSTGNVGIGTSSPSAKLEVEQATSGEGLRIDGASGGFALVVEGGSSYKSILRNASIGTSYFGNTAPTDGLIVEGNVGIGDPSPSYVLDVNNTSSRVRFKANTGDSSIELSSIAGRDWLVSSKTDGAFSIYDEDAASERMRIDSAGNVGIGTSSPDFTLDVEKDVDTWVSRIYNTGSDSNSQALLIRSDATAAHDSLVLGVYADGGYKMTIKSSGNVGIGTSSPSAKLHVYSGEAIIATNTDGLKLSYSAGNSSGIVDTAFSDNNLEFRTNGSTKMWIANAGNVGIGTTTPETKLDVDGDIQTAAPETSTNAAWKLGNVGLGGVEVGPIDYITVSVGGFVVKLPIAIFPETQAFYDRVIADGGTFEGLLGYESAVTILKAQ